MSALRDAVLRTLCFHAAWDHAPTLPELVCGLDVGASSPTVLPQEDVRVEIGRMVEEGTIALSTGRYALPARLSDVLAAMRDRDILQPRKRRAARRTARLLSRMGGVRFVALANTTALGNARDGGDLDFFVVARGGSLWTVRLLSAGPLRLMGKLPTKEERPDAVCLSYFVSDRSLDLTAHMLAGDDPYFRHWFLSLLPLVDDGIGSALWTSNGPILRRHPFARPWIVSPDLRVGIPRAHIGLGEAGERLAEKVQRSWFPSAIRERQNKGTDVLVGPDALKFHVDDRREVFKENFLSYCKSYGIEA